MTYPEPEPYKCWVSRWAIVVAVLLILWALMGSN